MSPHPRVLFIINEVAHFGEVKRILCDPKVAANLDSHVLFDRDGYDAKALFAGPIGDCQRLGISYSVVPFGSFREGRGLPGIGRLQNRLLSPRLKKLPGSRPLATFLDLVYGTHRQVDYYHRKIKHLAKWIEEQKFVSVVLGEENVLLETFLYGRAACGKNVVIYPYTIPNVKEMAGGACLARPWSQPCGKLLFFLGGRWTRRFDEQVLLLMAPRKILAMAAVGYFPKSPWVLNSGHRYKICVESEAMADLYRRLGVPEESLSVTGTMNDDVLGARLVERAAGRSRLNQRYGFDPSLPLVVIGFPPAQFPRAGIEYESYDALVKEFGETLSRLKGKASFLVSRHPRTDHALSGLTEAGAILSDEPLIEILPSADLYVASASATIRWAITAGIPVLNYDLYRYHYGDYDEAPAVITVSDRKAFSEELRRLVEEKKHLEGLKKLQVADSGRWGMLDGASSKRLIEVLIAPQTISP